MNMTPWRWLGLAAMAYCGMTLARVPMQIAAMLGHEISQCVRMETRREVSPEVWRSTRVDGPIQVVHSVRLSR